MGKKHTKKRCTSNTTSRPPEDWKRVFDALDRTGMPDELTADRGDQPPQERDIFHDEEATDK